MCAISSSRLPLCHLHRALPFGWTVTLDDGVHVVCVGRGNHLSVSAEPVQRTIALPFAFNKMSKCPGSICPPASSVHAKMRLGIALHQVL